MESFTIINNSIISSNISNGAFRLFCLLSQKCYGNKENCFPSQRTLAKEANVCVRTIQRWLTQLKNAKMVSIEHRIGTSNLYTILQKIKLQQQLKNKFTNFVKDKFKGCRASNERQYDAKVLEDFLLKRSEIQKE